MAVAHFLRSVILVISTLNISRQQIIEDYDDHSTFPGYGPNLKASVDSFKCPEGQHVVLCQKYAQFYGNLKIIWRNCPYGFTCFTTQKMMDEIGFLRCDLDNRPPFLCDENGRYPSYLHCHKEVISDSNGIQRVICPCNLY